MGNDEFLKYLHQIASDLSIARSSLWCCVSLNGWQGRGQWVDLLTPLQHFATTAMTIHSRRIVDRYHKKYPKRSFRTLARFLKQHGSKLNFYAPWSMISDLQMEETVCWTCTNLHCSTEIDMCRECLSGHIGLYIERLCDGVDNDFKPTKIFRDVWVAHPGIPEDDISATYACFMKMLYLFERLLHELALCFGAQHELGQYDISNAPHRFHIAIGNMLEILDGENTSPAYLPSTPPATPPDSQGQ